MTLTLVSVCGLLGGGCLCSKAVPSHSDFSVTRICGEIPPGGHAGWGEEAADLSQTWAWPLPPQSDTSL